MKLSYLGFWCSSLVGFPRFSPNTTTTIEFTPIMFSKHSFRRHLNPDPNHDEPWTELFLWNNTTITETAKLNYSELKPEIVLEISKRLKSHFLLETTSHFFPTSDLTKPFIQKRRKNTLNETRLMKPYRLGSWRRLNLLTRQVAGFVLAE